MALDAEILVDFAELLNEHGVTVRWEGEDYLALMSRVRADQQIDLGGFVETPDLRLRIPRATFSNGIPSFGQIIEVDGSAYRVVKVGTHPASPILTFELIGSDE